MTHQEFVAAYQAGNLTVHVDQKAATRFVSGQMMLPLLLLPLYGIAVAVALTGYFIAGAFIFVAALVFRYLVRASARGFILAKALKDPTFFAQAIEAGILRI